MIGHGGAGTAYCIEDINTSIWLAMKEVSDSMIALVPHLSYPVPIGG